LNKRIRQAANAANREVNEHKVSNIDYGQGRIAVAQREILEVLLNKPELFGTVKNKVSINMFDVPILKQIAEILLEALQDNINVSLREILAKTDSTELSNCLMELVQTGEDKGNYESRLIGALDTIDRHKLHKQNNSIKTVKDQKEYLHRLQESKGKENPHSVGMV
jgi:hypothetical protein